MELNQSRLKVDNARDLPYLDLYVKAQWQQQQNYGDLFSGNADWYNLHIAGLRLNVPILGGNRRQTRRETMVIENERLELKRDLAERSQQLQRNKAISDLEIALETIDIIKSEVDLRAAQTERANRRYQEGVGGLREVLDAEADLTRSTLDLNRGILELEIAKLELLKSQNNLLMLAQ
jgi:outer membrane protein TolC